MSDEQFAFSLGYPDQPGYQRTDTSRQAAREVAPQATSIRMLCLETLKRGPATADEVADALGLSILTVRPRITELKVMGRVEDTGQRRINEISGKSAAVLRIAPGAIPDSE